MPALWKYDDVRAAADGSRPPDDRARRPSAACWSSRTPASAAQSQITQSLYAGLQLILPGEVAPSHRHTASALRFVVEGDGGGYTAVDGERTTMRTGRLHPDAVLDLPRSRQSGSTPVIWMDVLDVPIVNMFDTSFAEHHPRGDAAGQPARKATRSRATARNLLPLEYTPIEAVLAGLQLSVRAQPRGARPAVIETARSIRVTA